MIAFYNEIDPGAAAWLRDLIAEGHIAPGIVDERDIRDIRPDELAEFTQCHFFAGIGGWSLALRMAGWQDDRPVWTGSCPCQPFSAAGKRAGTADERHLWPHWFHLIGECAPAIVFGEQVASKDGLGWLDLVCADLEGSGYAVGAADLCVAGIGGPHIRQRLWFGAERLEHASGDGRGERGAEPGERSALSGRFSGGLAHSLGTGVWGQSRGRTGAEAAPQGTAQQRQRGGFDARGSFANGGLAHGVGAGLERLGADGDHGHEPGRFDADEAGPTSPGRNARGLADRDGPRPLSGPHTGIHCGQEGPGPRDAELERLRSVGGLADAGSRERGRGTDLQGRHLGHGQDTGRPEDRCDAESYGVAGWPSPLHGFWGTADWLYCRDGKWRPVEPGSFPLAHGVSSRVGLLRGYGNAISPPVAAEFIRAWEEARAVTEPVQPVDLFAWAAQ